MLCTRGLREGNGGHPLGFLWTAFSGPIGASWYVDPESRLQPCLRLGIGLDGRCGTRYAPGLGVLPNNSGDVPEPTTEDIPTNDQPTQFPSMASFHKEN